MADEGSDARVVITMRDVYIEQRNTSAKIAGLEAMISTVVATNGATHAAQDQRFVDMERRLHEQEKDIRALETKAVVTPKSMWTAISVLGGFFFAMATIITTVLLAIIK